MTTLGHSLVGSAFASVSYSKSKKLFYRIFYFLIFIFIANIPDLPFKFWGHSQYHISHSIFINLTIIIIGLVFLAFCQKCQESIGGFKTVIFGVITWLSHFLLDSFYNHGKGVAIFWPFSDAHLTLPIPWFEIIGGFPIKWNHHTFHVLLIEFVSYFPLVIIGFTIRKFSRKF